MRPSSGMDLRKNAGVKEESMKLILPCLSTSRYCHGVSFRLFSPSRRCRIGLTVFLCLMLLVLPVQLFLGQLSV